MEEKKLPFTGREKSGSMYLRLRDGNTSMCARQWKIRRSAETGNLPKGESLV